jgi:hypothetical protein
MALAGDADGVTRMRLPDRWSGAEDLWRAVKDVKAEGGKLRRLSNAEIEVTHQPGRIGRTGALSAEPPRAAFGKDRH